MKTIVLAAALLLVALQVSAAAAPPFVVKCMKDNGVTGADVVKFAETGEASEGVKCNFKCIMINAGVMTEDGKMSLAPMLEHAPESVHQAFKDCMNIETTSDLCEYAFRHHVCLREKAAEWYKDMTKKRIEMMGL